MSFRSWRHPYNLSHVVRDVVVPRIHGSFSLVTSSPLLSFSFCSWRHYPSYPYRSRLWRHHAYHPYPFSNIIHIILLFFAREVIIALILLFLARGVIAPVIPLVTPWPLPPFFFRAWRHRPIISFLFFSLVTSLLSSLSFLSFLLWVHHLSHLSLLSLATSDAIILSFCSWGNYPAHPSLFPLGTFSPPSFAGSASPRWDLNRRQFDRADLPRLRKAGRCRVHRPQEGELATFVNSPCTTAFSPTLFPSSLPPPRGLSPTQVVPSLPYAVVVPILADPRRARFRQHRVLQPYSCSTLPQLALPGCWLCYRGCLKRTTDSPHCSQTCTRRKELASAVRYDAVCGR